MLATDGGVLARLAAPAKFGLLPRFGDGHQVMSWISLTDEIGAIRFLLDPDATDRSGPFNLTAPEPGDRHRAHQRRCTRPSSGPTSAGCGSRKAVLRLALGEMSSELLNSARVLPRRLLAAGFRFEYPTIAAALAAELDTGPQVNVTPSRSGTRST